MLGARETLNTIKHGKFKHGLLNKKTYYSNTKLRFSNSSEINLVYALKKCLQKQNFLNNGLGINGIVLIGMTTYIM